MSPGKKGKSMNTFKPNLSRSPAHERYISIKILELTSQCSD